jgi:hypothetical protein
VQDQTDPADPNESTPTPDPNEHIDIMLIPATLLLATSIAARALPTQQVFGLAGQDVSTLLDGYAGGVEGPFMPSPLLSYPPLLCSLTPRQMIDTGCCDLLVLMMVWTGQASTST